MEVPGSCPPSRLFFVLDCVTGMCFLVDSGAEASVIPVSNTSGKRKETPVFLQAVNHSPIQTYSEQSLTLNLGLHRIFQWVFTITKLTISIILVYLWT